MRDLQSYHVEWFIGREARRDVTVQIHNGQLLSVESGRTTNAIELGSVALVAGLVNAHTHLEFSGIQQPISMTGRFTDWIRAVVAFRQTHPDAVGNAIRAGVHESLKSGTTLLGDVATSGWTWPDYSATGFTGVVFQEILGLLPDRIAQQKEVIRRHVLDGDGGMSSLVRAEESPHPAWLGRGDQNTSGWDRPIVAGISPHAPYSTHLELVREAVNFSVKTDSLVAMHLAETRAELELLTNESGEFRELLTDFGLWRNDSSRFGRRPLDYLEILARAPRSLIVHGNYLNDEELKFLATQRQMTLVYCPRTHAAFGHSEHPWRRALELGVRVALGTDSRASNPNLSLFEELQFLASRNPDISHVELLQLGSNEGRCALGFQESNDANFTLIRLENPRQNPERELFASANSVSEPWCTDGGARCNLMCASYARICQNRLSTTSITHSCDVTRSPRFVFGFTFRNQNLPKLTRT